MQIQLAYGEGQVAIECPDDRTTVITPSEREGLSDERAALMKALDEPIGSPPLRHLVKAGQNKVTLEPSGKGSLAYQIVTVHYLPWREQVQPVEQPPLTIDVAYDALTLEAGDTLGVNVKVQYHRPGTANMTLVDLGIPPGFAVMPEFFQALKDDGMIEKYTSNGRQITLYFREISSERPIEFAYELRAKFPVKAKTPKSVAYQYYEPEIRAVAPPVEIKVEKSRRLGYLR